MPWAHGESAARFLGVEEWQGSFTHVLTEGGNTTLDGCDITWVANHNADATMTLARGLGVTGIQYWDSVLSSIVLAETYSEDLTAVCPGDPSQNSEYTATADPGRTEGDSFFIKVDANNNTYDVSILATVPAKYSFTACSFCPFDSGSDWYPLVNITDLPLPSTGMVLSGTASINMTGCNSCGANFTTPIGVLGAGLLGGTITVTWNFKGKSDLKVLVTPLAYQDWIPEGNIKDPTKRGNFIQIRARLVKGNGQPADVKAKKFTFKFTDVSAELGICLNYPPAAQANNDPDLKFENDPTQMPVSTWTISDSGKQADTVDGEYSEITATVSAFDFGAYGDLTVTADVDGETLEGKLESDESKKTLLLPRRQDDSKIADAWKESPKGATGLADSDDSENDPVGDTDKGDGFTLYEEYRGFVVNRTHVNPDPKKKDLFVRTKVSKADSGIKLFGKLSGLNVIYMLRADEFPDDRLMNFNHSNSDRHSVEQHGILIEQGTSNTTYAVALPEDHPPDTPVTVTKILLPPRLATGSGIVSQMGTIVVGSTDYAAAVIAHEIGHGCAIHHHGETKEDVVWTAYQNGTNVVLRESGGQGDLEIVVKNEAGTDITAALLQIQTALGNAFPLKLELGVLNGLHSGDANCIMRYNSEQAYRARPAGFPSTRYWVDVELIGNLLCTITDGTIVNSSAWKPYARFEGCAAGRGKCKDQICVNDKYMGNHAHP